LHATAAPFHHDLHPHPKIQAQKLMENTAVETAAKANTTALRAQVPSEDIGAIINRRNPCPPEGV
jgi:hypothetical protein